MKEKIYEYIKNNQLDIEAIMKKYTNYIYVVIQNKTRNLDYEDIEEIISDVFLTLWNNQKKLDTNKNLAPYIAGITSNLIKKKYRNKKTYENIEDYQEKLIVTEKINIYSETEEKNEMILQELNQMKKEEQIIFMMFYYETKKIKEIASILNISESKVKMKLSRTRKKLKKIIERKEI